MAVESKSDQEVYYHGAFDRARLKTWAFWRNMAIHFSLCSVVGHWLEIPWCVFCLYAFGIYDPNSMVWVSPFYPFMVYGVGAVVCVILLTPLKDRMLRKRKTRWGACLEFYTVCVVACMVMEVAMGLLMNQPDAARVYPLWDNSKLPLNILQQAWLPNDLLLGACALVYTWFVYPRVERLMARPHPKVMDVLALLVVVGFIALSVVQYSTYL